MTRRRRQWLAGLAGGVLLISSGVAGMHTTGAPGASPAAGPEGELPPLVSTRMDRMRQPVPGEDGLSPDGPAAAQLAEYLERAYPGNTITVAQLDAAKASFARSQTRSIPAKAKARQPGGWTRLGPTEAIYPRTDLRTSSGYVPNEYAAGGRTTDIALSHVCVTGNCRAWITPAGGGVWRTDDILAEKPVWKYLGGPLGINAAGAVTVDRNDPKGRTIYVGTGEANSCGDCMAGVGIYKSTNGGTTWTGPLGKAELGGKGIGKVVVKPGDPKTLYAATTFALTGISSACCVARPDPTAAKWGLYKSTDAGATWRFVHNGSTDPTACTGSVDESRNLGVCSPRGVRNVELDPADPQIVYAGSFARGIWRSPDGGATWTQIKPSLDAANANTRPAFDVARLPNGKTRMYVYEGNTGTPTSRLFRSDDVTAEAPAFTDLTSANPADPGFAWHNLCGPQCFYDVFVHSPDGHPDMVYVGGSYSFGQRFTNKRGVVLSTDAGLSGTDMTMDGTDPLHPNGLHPDQHAIATNPHDPLQFFEANDGGVMRSSGVLVDRSSFCDHPRRRLTVPEQIARCRQMLSAIPSKLDGVNSGLSTLQFMSLSVSPHDHRLLQGGTQDNGTWQNGGAGTDNVTWLNTMIGDGGQSGFDVAKPEFRFHNYFDANPEVNFNHGAVADWIITGDPVVGHPNSLFYVPHISDPRVSGTMFIGTGRTAYRTTTFGLGNRTLDEAQRLCNTFTGTGAVGECGDWAELGPKRLTDPSWGDREGGAVAAIERTRADTATAWVATSRGRVFVTTNVDAADPAAVAFTRLDDDSTAAPNRFVSSIYVDPTDGNHAWISYSGYDRNTPTTPGHVFEVRFDPATGTSTWLNRSFDLGDLPVTDLVRDDAFGDLYAATDFGVLRLAVGTTTWTAAAPGMPNVEVAGLTIVPNKRVLYAATHGLGAWRLRLG